MRPCMKIERLSIGAMTALVLAALIVLASTALAPAAMAQDGEASTHGELSAPEGPAEPEVEPPPISSSPPPRTRQPRLIPPAYDARAENLSDPQRFPFAPEPAAAETAPLEATIEVSLSLSPFLGLGSGGAGGLGSLGSLSGNIGSRTDFVFAADERVYLGFGLGASYWESETSSLQLGRVSVPLIAQVYLDTPRLGEAVPTLRFVPTFRWSGDTTGSVSGAPAEWIGGGFAFGVGMTWFATEWLAVRLLGNISGSLDIVYRGPTDTTFYLGAGADLGVVVRL